MAYCGRCRIGTVGADGLCVLCGASQEPDTTRTRLAEAGGTFLSQLLSPVWLVVAMFILLVGGIGALAKRGVQGPSGMPGILGAAPIGVPDAAHATPGAVLGYLLGPAILQSIVVLIIILAIVLLLRLRRGRQERAAETY
jgi:hypothetical protein